MLQCIVSIKQYFYLVGTTHAFNKDRGNMNIMLDCNYNKYTRCIYPILLSYIPANDWLYELKFTIKTDINWN